MRSDLTPRQLIGFMLAASLASTIGGLPFNALPVLLGSLADSLGLAPRAVGLMGSACFAGYLLGTLGAPFWMNRLDWRLLTFISALGTALSFALSAWVGTPALQYAIWALIGFFASTMTCLGMRILADLPNKERAYGVRQGVELSVTAAVLFVLPPLVIAPFKYPGAPQTASGLALPAAAWAALAVFFLFLVGNIGLWAFLERIGASLAIAPAQMGTVFAVLKLLGGAAAFAVALLGHRLLPRTAFAGMLLLIGAGLALLAGATDFVSFAVGAWTWEFAFTCGCVLQVAAIARSDASGRAVVLVPAAFALASMAGPALAGFAAADGRFGLLLGFALLSSLVPVLFNGLRQEKAALHGRAARR
jgi:hypothetical protein